MKINNYEEIPKIKFCKREISTPYFDHLYSSVSHRTLFLKMFYNKTLVY